jgi:ATP-dependent DNA helicase RecG
MTELQASSAPIHPVFAEALKTTPEVAMEVTMEVRRLLNVMAGEHSRRELQKLLGLRNADHFRKAYLLSAMETGVVDMTLPDKKSGRKRWADSESPDNHPNSRKSVRPTR